MRQLTVNNKVHDTANQPTETLKCTVHFGSLTHYLLNQKRDTMGSCLSCRDQRVYQKKKSFPHILICALGCMFDFWRSQKVCHGGKGWGEEGRERVKWVIISEKSKKLMLNEHIYFLWQLFLDKASPRPIQKSRKTLHHGYCSCSHIGVR